MTFVQQHWGDLASVLGFVITIWVLIKTRSAAVAAKTAAEDARSRITRIDTISDFSSAITMMDEIKRLHRAKAWDLLPDRYAVLRRLLLSIQTTNPNLQPNQKSALGSAIAQFRIMEDRLEKARATEKQAELDSARFNRIVSKQIDDLDCVLIAIKQGGG